MNTKRKTMSFCHLDFYNPLIQQLILSDPAAQIVLSYDLDWDGSPSDLDLAFQIVEDLETARGVPESEGVRARIARGIADFSRGCTPPPAQGGQS